MKRKTIKLNENQLKRVIAEATKRILREGTSFNDNIEKWQYLKETAGEEQMLECLFQWASSDQIEQWLEWFEEEGYFEGSPFERTEEEFGDEDELEGDGN